MHHVPQPDAAGVVLHPARLEGGVLTAVGKDDELLVPLRGGVDHRLGENVNVGDRDRLDLAGGSISRPPIRNEGVLQDGHAESAEPKAISGRSGSRCPQPSARQWGEASRCIAPH